MKQQISFLNQLMCESQYFNINQFTVKSDSFIKIHKEEKEDISLRESWIEQEKEMT